MSSNSTDLIYLLVSFIPMIMVLLMYAFIFIFIIVYFIVIIAMTTIVLISKWKIFEKAGRQGWEGIIPFYNNYVMAELFTANSMLWFVLSLIPYANIVAIIILTIGMLKAFGKEAGFIVFTIFFPFIGLPMLAFGKNTKYVGYKFGENN